MLYDNYVKRPVILPRKMETLYFVKDSPNIDWISNNVGTPGPNSQEVLQVIMV